MHYMLIYFKRLRLISLAIHLFAKTFTVSFRLKETETKAIVRVFNELLTSIYLETSLPTRILNKCYFSSHLSRKFTHFCFVSPVWKYPPTLLLRFSITNDDDRLVSLFHHVQEIRTIGEVHPEVSTLF